MTRRRIFYGIVLTAAIIYYIFHTGYSSFFVLMAVVGFIPVELLASIPVLLSSKIKISAEQSSLTAGENAVIRLQLNSGYPICLLKLKWVCRNKFTGETLNGKLTANPEDQNSMMFVHREQSCGVLEFKIVNTRILDIAGIFALPITNAEPLEIPFNPAPVYINIDIPEPSQTETQALQGKKPGYITAPEFSDIREYRQGDSVRDIHWKLSAKLSKMMVREKASQPGAAFTFCCGETENAQEYCLVLSRVKEIALIFLRSEVSFTMLWQDDESEWQRVLVENADDFLNFLWKQLAFPYNKTNTEPPETGDSLLIIGLDDIKLMQDGLVKEVLQ